MSQRQKALICLGFKFAANPTGKVTAKALTYTERDHERGKLILYGQDVIVCFTPHWL
jgi:hypothetical protein